MFKNKISFGIILYLIGCFISIFSSVFVKKVMVDYKLPAWEVIAIRQSIIVAILIPFMIKMKFNFFDKKTLKPNLIRNILYAFSIGLLHISLFKIPVNNGVVLQFLTPIIASLLAIFILKEENSLFLWISLIICLCGVFVIQQPSFGDNNILFAYILLFVSILLKSFITILNRKLALNFPTHILIFYMHTIILLVSLCFCFEFVKFPKEVVFILGIVGVFYLLEYVFVYISYKYCKVTITQPLEFSKIIYSIILSNLVLGENVNYIQILGISIIIFGFLFMIFSKRIKNK